ncbi:MAG: hypothetical protein IPN17_25480 [Deltaproteobacteria bacterium]|nr:hypothetical protein [Deltaproteobacteria bacterium]
MRSRGTTHLTLPVRSASTSRVYSPFTNSCTIALAVCLAWKASDSASSMRVAPTEQLPSAGLRKYG